MSPFVVSPARLNNKCIDPVERIGGPLRTTTPAEPSSRRPPVRYRRQLPFAFITPFRAGPLCAFRSPLFEDGGDSARTRHTERSYDVRTAAVDPERDSRARSGRVGAPRIITTTTKTCTSCLTILLTAYLLLACPNRSSDRANTILGIHRRMRFPSKGMSSYAVVYQDGVQASVQVQRLCPSFRPSTIPRTLPSRAPTLLEKPTSLWVFLQVEKRVPVLVPELRSRG
ncbi:hypothetical protein SCP_0601530 [Sparassis crispa]|uniref:Uncharacterized protein n=1 Tax=Sparassis crispa TaxID=139825 RepID=A0A401GPL8_9APHY|nr:hypothetical protein SCP_0601530 [Sparassis crispa]GBE84175.1 hypothetical protein SCP_0601530 [Sparassis crispa]